MPSCVDKEVVFDSAEFPVDYPNLRPLEAFSAVVSGTLERLRLGVNMYENCESEIKSDAPRGTHFSTFRVEVTVVEEVTSQQVLEVRAGSSQQAERIAEEESGSWRNGESSRRVKIIEPEHIVDAEDTFI